MKTFLILQLMIVISLNYTFSQKSLKYIEKYSIYENAKDLYDKKMYSQSQEFFEEAKKHIQDIKDEYYIRSDYYIALCALYLNNDDKYKKLSEFITNYSFHPLTLKIDYIVAIDYYNNNKFDKAVLNFNKIELADLQNDEKQEFLYKRGFSYLKLEKKENALNDFDDVNDTNSDFYHPAKYYFAHLNYVDSNYQTALLNFEKIENNDDYKNIVPYYKSNIYYNQEKYLELIDYSNDKIKDEETKKIDEIKGLLGSAYYKIGNYKKATEFLQHYITNVDENSKDSYFQLADSYYKIEDYKNAKKYFGRIGNSNDLKGQIANYYLANCYLKENNNLAAKNAFKTAYDQKFDEKITEEALYAYAKLSYILSNNPYDDAINLFHKYLDDYPKSSKSNDVYEYLINMYFSTKNYDQALNSINKLKEMNFRTKEAYQILSYNKATELYQKSDFELSRSYFENSKKYNINSELSSNANYWLAEMEYRKKNYTKAKQLYNSYLSGSSSNNSLKDDAFFSLGYCDFELKDYGNSITNFKTFIEKSNNNNNITIANLKIADAYYLLKNDDLASNYYQKVIDYNKYQVDYALFQRAQVEGYLENYDTKQSIILKLKKDFPNSPYNKNSDFELANIYRIKNMNQDAIKQYNIVLKNESNNEILLKSKIYLAGLYSKEKQYDKAELLYREIIKNYKNTSESKLALSELQKVYNETDRLDKITDLYEELGLVIDNQELDSTLWQPASLNYFNGNEDEALKYLKIYLDKVKNPTHENNAYYYIANIYNSKNDKSKALENFEKVIQQNKLNVADASYQAAKIAYSNQDVEKSNIYFIIADSLNDKENRILVIKRALAKTYYIKKEYEKAIPNAQKIINNENIEKSIREEALMILANSNFELGNKNEANTFYKQVVKISKNENKAEAKYKMCVISYDSKPISTVEKEIYEFLEQKPTYDFWLAKAYILLADVYIKMNDLFQAKSTLQSIIDNYKGDENVLTEAKNKLESIKIIEQKND